MTRPTILDLDLVVVPQAMTPEMIAAAWSAWHSRHGGKIGPGPAFGEAVPAAISASPYPTAWDDVRKAYCELEQECEQLKANIDRLTSNPADHRYWEGRWRDAEARIAELEKRLADADVFVREFAATTAREDRAAAARAYMEGK